MKSDKPILSDKIVFGKRMFVFSMEYANDNLDGKKGMLVSMNNTNTFVPCGEPVDLSYDVWMLLKNIGRIGRIVSVKEGDVEKV